MVSTEGMEAIKRLLALAAVAVCVTGATACGSGDDGDGGNANANDAAQQSGDSEAQIRSTYDDFLNAVADKDAGAACDTMTTRAREEFSSYELGGKSCEKTLLTLMGNAVDGDNRPKILGVNIDGGKALARVRTGTGQTVSGVRFAKQDGQWKINGTAIAN